MSKQAVLLKDSQGITVIRKSNSKQSNSTQQPSKIALVLGSGLLNGNVFNIGALKAINDFIVDKKVVSFDIYVGTGTGAFLLIPLIMRFPPEELIKIVDGTSFLVKQWQSKKGIKKKDSKKEIKPVKEKPNAKRFSMQSLWNVKEIQQALKEYTFDFFTGVPPALTNWVTTIKALGATEMMDRMKEFIKKPGLSSSIALGSPFVKPFINNLPNPFYYLPSGMLISDTIEQMIFKAFKKSYILNDFTQIYEMSKKSLYISGLDLNSGERILFGPDKIKHYPVSKALEVSMATPMLVRPVSVDNYSLVSGSFFHPLNLDVALENGADLIICFNPLKPYQYSSVMEKGEEMVRSRVEYGGLSSVLNQLYRTQLHNKLQQSLNQFINDPNIKSDLILIEPTKDDYLSFSINPFSFKQRIRAVHQGYDSTVNAIENKDNQKVLKEILNIHSIQASADELAKNKAKMNASP